MKSQFRCLSPILALAIILLPGFTAYAQTEDPIAVKLGLTRENRSIPLWEKPSTRDFDGLAMVARSLRRALFQVGHPEAGSGTAFCISKQARLLVTNAHMADLKEKAGGELFAVMNETGYRYRVAKIWYHPGLVRKNVAGQRSVGAAPSFGLVESHSPDLAVLQLTKDGPDLPEAIALASPKEVEDLFASPIGMIGFPGYNTEDWPEPGEKPAATFQQGVVCRVTDFALNPAALRSRLRFVQHNLQSWPGTSGAPLFLPNGHVVAVNNSARAVAQETGEGAILATVIPQGIRVDVLWELLVQEKLTVHVTGKPEGLVAERYKKGLISDPPLERAIVLTRNGAFLLHSDKLTRFRDAAEKAAEAIRLTPGYWKGYEVRAIAFENYALYLRNFSTGRGEPPLPEVFQYLEQSQEALKEALRRAPGEAGLYGSVLNHIVNLADLRNDRAAQEEVLAVADRLLEGVLAPKHAVIVWNARGGALRSLGRYAESVECFTRAIAHEPDSPTFYGNRARTFARMGDATAAARDREKERQLRRQRREQ